MDNYWDTRYSVEEYIYGTKPNAFFKSIIDTLQPGKILVPAAGEGRDAIYAAKLGWEVFAVDQSVVAQQKALQLAQDEHVTINYQVCDILDFDLTQRKYNAIVLNYFHLPPDIRMQFHSKLHSVLLPNGYIILEAFNPKQLNNTSGGPQDGNVLMTADALKQEFSALQILECGEHEIILDEGTHHQGKADIVRFVGKNTNPVS